MPSTKINETDLPEDDPLHHTHKVKGMMRDLVTHLREDIGKFEEPRAQALFETSAEVILGLVNAFEDYEAQNEPAWRDD